MTTNQDIDVSIRPGKWIKRGPQPESAPQPTSPTRAIRDLIAQINAEPDPAEKARLEARFREECRAYDAINPDSMPMDIASVYAEIVETIAPIAFHGGVAISHDIHFPDEITKDRWKSIHRQIIACKRSANLWLGKSRKFAGDKWGTEYVEAQEAQMELDLGIERKELTEHHATAQEMLPTVARTAAKWATLAMRESGGWNRDQAAATLDALQPIADMIERLKVMAGETEA